MRLKNLQAAVFFRSETSTSRPGSSRSYTAKAWISWRKPRNISTAPAGLNLKRLAPQVSIAYTSESIKLTTRLTQLASWLLVRRAIAVGEITAAEAHTHRHKVTLNAQSGARTECFEDLPEAFKQLIGESHRLYGRILRLDPLLCEGYSAMADGASPISPQIERIKLEFPAA